MWLWITSSDQQSSRQCSPTKSVSGFSPAFMMYAMSAPGETWTFTSRTNTLHEAQTQPIIPFPDIFHSCVFTGLQGTLHTTAALKGTFTVLGDRAM